MSQDTLSQFNDSTAPESGDERLEKMSVDHDESRTDPNGHIDLYVRKIENTTRSVGGPQGYDKPVVHVFGVTSDGQKEHVKVHGFEPYFYAPSDETDRVADQDIVKNIEDRFKSVRQRDVSKITTYLPRHVGWIRDEFSTHYDADILFPNRFRIDKDINTGIRVPENREDDGTIVVQESEVEPVDVTHDHHILMADIEVEDRNGFPENGDEPIISITTYDSAKQKYIVWYYDSEDGECGPQEVPESYDPFVDSTDIDFFVEKLESEEELAKVFIEYIRAVDPSIMTGWNFVDFDAEYIIDRFNVLVDECDCESNECGSRCALDPDNLSRLPDSYKASSSGYDSEIKGRNITDLLYQYKRSFPGELVSYRLDAVADLELNSGKEVFSGDVGELWEEDPARLIEYNLRDVELCVELNRKQEIIPFWQQVAGYAGCSLSDAPTPGDSVDKYVLHKVRGKSILPSKGQAEGSGYEGSAVFEPISGVEKNVSVLDLKSLYPMCMCSVNASPETKVGDDYDGETYVAPNGAEFRKDKDGIIPEMVDELLAERDEKKRLRDQHDPDSDEFEKYDRQQAAVKILMNSLYGTLGWDRFRLFDKDISEAVTSMGRGVIRFSEDILNEHGYEVTYGDTDSVMFSISDISAEDVSIEDVPEKRIEAHPDYSEDELCELQAIINRSFEMEEIINDRYDEYAIEELNSSPEQHRFQMEFEKLYRRFFQAGKKKRYAGHIVWKEGTDKDETDITGFEYERSDQAPITKRVQKNVLEMILDGASPDEVREYVEGVVSDFKNGNVSVEDIAMPGGIGKSLDNYDSPQAQVRGAIYANIFLDTNYARGSKPKKLYLERVHPDFYRRKDIEPETSFEQKHYAEFKRNPDVICFEYEDELPKLKTDNEDDYDFAVDWDKMLDKTLEGPIERVIEPMGIQWNEVVSGQTQTGIAAYM